MCYLKVEPSLMQAAATWLMCLSMAIKSKPSALTWTVVLSAVQTLHFLQREGSITAFPVQVRLAYTLMVLVFLWKPLQPLLWIPAVGTVAQVLFGYCALARCLSLLPANRKRPFSMQLVLDTFLSRPVRGSVLQGLPARR